MYAIRSYYAFAVTYVGVAMAALPHGFAALTPTQLHGMAWAVASAVTYAIYLTARITSYNVCYTKLLRSRK